MAFSVVNWATLSEITSSKLRQMMDNDQYLYDGQQTMVQRVDYAQITSNQTGIASNTAISGLSIPVTTVGGHIYKVSFCFRSIFSTSVGSYGIQIRQDGTFVQESIVTCTLVSTGFGGGTVTAIINPAAGSHTYAVYIDRKTGTGTATLEAAANNPAILLVEDMGN